MYSNQNINYVHEIYLEYVYASGSVGQRFQKRNHHILVRK